jgi:hypothetical protein
MSIPKKRKVTVLPITDGGAGGEVFAHRDNLRTAALQGRPAAWPVQSVGSGGDAQPWPPLDAKPIIATGNSGSKQFVKNSGSSVASAGIPP